MNPEPRTRGRLLCEHRIVTNQALSAAVIAYIWGDHSQSWPSERPEALTEEQQEYLPTIKSALVAAFAHAPTEEDLSSAAVGAESDVRKQHPELSPEALRAIGNYYSFCWK